MGLPKPLRLPKKEFTVEEIYLNKNYRTPPEKSFETIFEFPKEHRDGTVMTYGKAKKKRKCVFTIDFTKKTAKRKVRKAKIILIFWHLHTGCHSGKSKLY